MLIAAVRCIIVIVRFIIGIVVVVVVVVIVLLSRFPFGFALCCFWRICCFLIRGAWALGVDSVLVLFALVSRGANLIG